MGYNALLYKIILIIGYVIGLYLATSMAMALELGKNQMDLIVNDDISYYCQKFLRRSTSE
ncbi:MAG: hypothetical protein PHAS_01044 [Phascolarctobacterium sp.]